MDSKKYTYQIPENSIYPVQHNAHSTKVLKLFLPIDPLFHQVYSVTSRDKTEGCEDGQGYSCISNALQAETK